MSHQRRQPGCLATAFKWMLILFVIYVVFHWLTGANSEFADPPPAIPTSNI